MLSNSLPIAVVHRTSGLRWPNLLKASLHGALQLITLYHHSSWKVDTVQQLQSYIDSSEL
eukprot:6462080-Amphidinium_carterae.1